MSESVTFTVALPPKELSPNARAHWRSKNVAKQAYAEEVWIAGRQSHEDSPNCRQCAIEEAGGMPWWWAAVHLVKHSTHETDTDNVIASCKVLIDCLTTKGTRPLGIVEDDGPGHMTVTA